MFTGNTRGIESPQTKRGPWVLPHLLMLAVMITLSACGDDGDVLNAGHTVHGSLWTSFYATVKEQYTLVDPLAVSDTELTSQLPLTDIWSVDDIGLAQYLSNQGNAVGGVPGGAPVTVAAKKLDATALDELKNQLARSRILSWPDVITCDKVVCRGSQGTATIDVNLNGTSKTVTWPLYASGLPDGLEVMAQLVKDAI